VNEPAPDYHARAGMYRLLLGYATLLTPDPGAPAVYRAALESMITDNRARDIVTQLAGTALGGYIEKYGGTSRLRWPPSFASYVWPKI
jgi:hypothetical protein